MAEVRRRCSDYLPPIEKARTKHSNAPVVKPGQLEEDVLNMVTMASHYKNWERALGTPGVALVLGNIEGET